MKKVLFVCIENSCRSQIAEGFARKIGKDVLQVFSAGSNPSGKVNPMAIKMMQDAGIDISNQESKGFDSLDCKNFDYVITLGCKDRCPFIPAKQHIDWKVEDPKGKDEDFFRKVRDQIKYNVEQFLNIVLI